MIRQMNDLRYEGATPELTPEQEEEIDEISARNLVAFYSDELLRMGRRRLTESVPPGAIRRLRELGILALKRTHRKGKVLYLTEKGMAILGAVSAPDLQTARELEATR